MPWLRAIANALAVAMAGQVERRVLQSCTESSGFPRRLRLKRVVSCGYAPEVVAQWQHWSIGSGGGKRGSGLGARTGRKIVKQSRVCARLNSLDKKQLLLKGYLTTNMSYCPATTATGWMTPAAARFGHLGSLPCRWALKFEISGLRHSSTRRPERTSCNAQRRALPPQSSQWDTDFFDGPHSVTFEVSGRGANHGTRSPSLFLTLFNMAPRKVAKQRSMADNLPLGHGDAFDPPQSQLSQESQDNVTKKVEDAINNSKQQVGLSRARCHWLSIYERRVGFSASSLPMYIYLLPNP